MPILWPKSSSIEFDQNGERAVAAKAYFYEGGTTTPLTVYQDAAQTITHASPVVANGIGRWPDIYIPYTASYDARGLDSGGMQLFYSTNVPNLDPIDAAAAVDETAILQTGDVIWSPFDGSRSGFVPLNGGTIGSATSGANVRAHADTSDLFTFLWNNLPNAQAAVSGGRGVTAAADFAANKTIQLLDGRSAGLMGLDTMGNGPAGLLGSTTFTNGDAVTPGSIAGTNSHTLTIAQLPVVTPAGSIGYTPEGTISQFTPSGTINSPSITITDPGHTHGLSPAVFSTATNQLVTVTGAGTTYGSIGPSSLNITASNTTGITAALATNPVFTGSLSSSQSFTGTAATLTLSGTAFGSGTAHNNVAKSLLGSFFQKL